MGQKTNPVGLRIGITCKSSAVWYSSRNYAKLFLEDERIRQYILKKLKSSLVGKIIIERSSNKVHIVIHSARPGMVIGKKGSDLETLKKELAEIADSKEVNVSTVEIHHPEQNACLVADSIAQKMAQGNYRRAMKKAISLAMFVGVKGIKICCSGRLNGVEIARSECVKMGTIPLHTLRADIDYAFAIAHTPCGICGVKVWIYKDSRKEIKESK